jgi:rhomboid protease GluP
MAARQFGQRGAMSAHAAPPYSQTRVAVAAPASRLRDTIFGAAPDEEDQSENEVSEAARLLAHFPILTAAIILFLMLVFIAEKHFAPDARGNQLSHGSLVALGGASRKLVFESGEWWRMFLAPIFHASGGHLVGNCIALAFVGTKLEPLLGRWWMCATFALAAMGGMAGSLIGNPAEITTVGASGAITGLIGALFALSFHNRAQPETRMKMRRTALFFGIPALGPLWWGASGNTDYFAHLGGAVAGVAVGIAIGVFWDGRSFRPGYQKVAAGITIAGLALAGVSAGMASTRFATYVAIDTHLIPLSQMPRTALDGAGRADYFVSRFPRDPRAHLFRAVALMKSEKLLAAEEELRSVLATAHEAGPGKAPLEQLSRGYLALIFAYQGRRADAQAMAQSACAPGVDSSLAKMLQTAKLCR